MLRCRSREEAEGEAVRDDTDGVRIVDWVVEGISTEEE